MHRETVPFPRIKYTFMEILQPNSLYWDACFANRFFCSVNHLRGPLRKQMFTCVWCISIHFVCFCLSRFVACDRPFSGNSRPVFFKYFSDLSYSYSRVILSFVFAGQAGRVRCIVININSDTTNLAIRYSFRVRARVNKELKQQRRRRLRKRYLKSFSSLNVTSFF